MYPTVVIVLIETQRSITDVCEISSSNASKPGGPVSSKARPATLGCLSFAVEPVLTTTDNETESRQSLALQSQDGQEQGLENFIGEVKESRAG